MRSSSHRFAVLALVAVLALAAATLGKSPLARAEEESPSRADLLEGRVDALDKLVEYLLARDRAVTAYLVAEEERGRALEDSLALAREQGFTMAAMPYSSRETLLEALGNLARQMRTDLPQVTEEQKQILVAAARAR